MEQKDQKESNTSGRNRREPRVREMMKALKKMHIENGDTLMIKQGTNLAKVEYIDELIEAGGKIGLDQVLIIVVDDFDSIALLNENEMAKHGWFRIKTLEKLIHIKPEADRDVKIENGDQSE